MFKSAGALLLTALVTGAVAQPFATWNRFREITINTTSTGGGANVAGSVANFPVLVRLEASGGAATGGNILTEALSGGADVRFTDESGATALDYHIEHWSAARAAIWVKVPSVAGNANTKIRVYWGRSGQTTASNGAAVFDTANGYTGVWNLNEDGAGNVVDATSNALHFTGNAQVPAVPGVAGNARYYNQGVGGQDEYKVDERANDPKFYAQGADTRITISAWVNRRAQGSSGSQGVFSNFRYSAGANRSYALMRNPDGNFNVLTSVNGSGDTRRVSTSEVFADNEWHHVVTTINPAGGEAPVIRIWVNGVAQATTGGNAAGANAAVFQATAPEAQPLIGALERAFQQGTESFIDALWFSNGTIRDSNWIGLAYQTQKPNATAITMGATQSVAPRAMFYPLKNAVYQLNAAIPANTPTVSGAASNFTITPSTLPAGLSFNASTGAITGTPTAAIAQTQFRVNATVGGNPAADTITIAVSAGDPPGAPTNVLATSGNAQAVITWTAPLATGTSPITGYQARATQDTSKSCTWTTGPLTCTITGLTNGTSYTFVVRASSAVGAGEFSSASTPVTPAGPPGSPTNVVLAPHPSIATSLNATWTPPANTGGSLITDYFGTAIPGGVACYSPPVEKPTCTFNNLTVGTSYRATVVAASVAGNSAPSDTSAPLVLTNIQGGAFALQVTRNPRPFTFALTPEAVKSTEALTMSVTDIYGRTVWSKTVRPSQENVREVTWNGRTSTGNTVSAGVYMVKVSTVNGGNTASFIRPATMR